MSQIRVRSGIEVSVNDNNETIIINIEDQKFMEGFYRIFEKTYEIANRLSNEEEKSKEGIDILHDSMEASKEIMKDLDLLFGEGCCRKVFGDIVPNSYLIADFFDQLLPIMAECADTRYKGLKERYNRDRKGSGKRG